jgi:quinol monooxygenase YgiN
MLLELSFIGLAQSTANHSKEFRKEWYGPKGKEGRFMEVTIKFKARQGKFQELYQVLQGLLPTIRKEKGCREWRIYRDVEDGEVFFLSGHWETQAKLEHYLGSTNGMALLGVIDLLTERAAVKTGQGAAWEGIDVLKRMRKKTQLGCKKSRP